MIRVEDPAEIRRMHRVEGLPARAVAWQLGISRNTVLWVSASDRPPQYRRKPKAWTSSRTSRRIRRRR
ncbi:hypothetical protein GCM10022206_38240 [Streptomyces chiangmaiensis]